MSYLEGLTGERLPDMMAVADMVTTADVVELLQQSGPRKHYTVITQDPSFWEALFGRHCGRPMLPFAYWEHLNTNGRLSKVEPCWVCPRCRELHYA